MIYQAYQTYADATEPLRTLAKVGTQLFTGPWPGRISDALLPRVAAACEVFSRTGLTHERPPFDIGAIEVEGRVTEVEEEVVAATPFCSLLHFRKHTPAIQPRVLIVAPMSGHFATLLRGTVRTMLRDHDVYVTDWHNIRDVPLSAGRFGLDEFAAHVIEFLEKIGEGAHVMAVCQPTVAVLSAVAVMAEDDNACQPRSMILMAGPIDTRVNPTEVNELATSKPLSWFERNLVGYVPWRYKGAMRRVYPGFLQLAAFMAMNLERHANSFLDLYRHRVGREPDKAEIIRTFYEEYFAMMDLPADFYLETVRAVFQEYLLPLGKLDYRGRRITPGAIRRTALLTIEGEKDDICSIGQTLAAQDLCSGIRPYRKRHHIQTGVGHYGVFNGRRWENEIYAIVRDTIHVND